MLHKLSTTKMGSKPAADATKAASGVVMAKRQPQLTESPDGVAKAATAGGVQRPSEERAEVKSPTKSTLTAQVKPSSAHQSAKLKPPTEIDQPVESASSHLPTGVRTSAFDYALREAHILGDLASIARRLAAREQASYHPPGNVLSPSPPPALVSRRPITPISSRVESTSFSCVPCPPLPRPLAGPGCAAAAAGA